MSDDVMQHELVERARESGQGAGRTAEVLALVMRGSGVGCGGTGAGVRHRSCKRSRVRRRAKPKNTEKR